MALRRSYDFEAWLGARGSALRPFGGLVWLLPLVAFLVGCQLKPDLLRYGNVTCLGYFSDSYSTHLPNDVDLRYGIPATRWSSGLQLTWLADSTLFAIYDASNALHLIDRSGHLVTQRDHDRLYWPNAVLSASSFLDMYALSFRVSGSLDTHTTEVHSFYDQALEESSPLATLRQLARAVWHPTEPKLAGKYYTEDLSVSSNIVAIFDISQSEETPTALFELDWSDISSELAWSQDGRLIAVSQFRRNGLIPVYLDIETGARKVSSFGETYNNCALDGKWSPSEESFAFQGRTESTESFDIFVEEVVLADKEQSAITNLTNTLKEDEVGVSWSLDGRQLAFVRGYLDESGDYQQELARITMESGALRPEQLTDTSDEFETAPLWIAEDEIAYLSWNFLQSKWYLMTLSVGSPDQQPETIMEIPESWYRQP